MIEKYKDWLDLWNIRWSNFPEQCKGNPLLRNRIEAYVALLILKITFKM
jgi:hypothetical protein